MDKQSQIFKVDLMGLAFAFILVLTAVALVWFRTSQVLSERHEKQLHQMQAVVTEKQIEVQGLRSKVATQRTEILASRSVGLLSIQPEAWRPMTATWYAEGGINGTGITFTGKRTVQDWTVAADPRVIPLGSIIEVRFSTGVTKVYQILDTGGAIKGNRLDIYDPSIQRCFLNGIQKVQVRVLVRGQTSGSQNR